MRAPTHRLAVLLCLLTACGSDDSEPTADPSADTQIRQSTDGVEPLAQEADTCGVATARPRNLTLRGNLGTHDPVIIAAGGRYYEYQTGKFVYAKVSNDLINWDPLPSQFPRVWDWMKRQVPGITDDLWAPDISFFGGKYHLYYSGSTFGSNRSCIGHATRTDLASGSWKDENGVICSNTGGPKQDYNAIDPNVVVDEGGTPWMSFGSFWSGIKLIKLTSDGKRADDTLISIAARPSNSGELEAPFIVRRCGYYYLFVSFDRCCKGKDSTYRVMVGRSKSVTGPYVDKSGRAMTQGGGTQVVAGNGTWKGPGHNAILQDKGKWYNVYHAYRASNGAAELRITEMGWDADGWPMSHAP
ncbi:MAG: arabinan endo-1,5-alpha-L-arabinosidase [Polyangiales bacterium]